MRLYDQCPILEVVTRHDTNFTSRPEGHILKPKHDANPAEVKDIVRNMRMPTGDYKVIYRPARDGEPAHSIAFLIPQQLRNRDAHGY